MFWWKKNKKQSGTLAPGVTEEPTDGCTLKVIVKTDLGNVRKNNEDAGTFVKVSDEAVIRQKGYLLLVADGMGGHNAGEVASKIAMDTISEEYFKKDSNPNKEKALANAFFTANKKIYELAQLNESYKGMGTTCTVLIVAGQHLYFAHAGDSRAYIFKNKKITQVTEDHTYVQQLVKNGDITAAEADVHPQRNVLINAMGTKPTLRVDTGKSDLTFNKDDKLLVCSDGLYDYLNDTELAEIMLNKDLQYIADYLIKEAKKRGGKDNITVVLAEKIGAAALTESKQTKDVELLDEFSTNDQFKLTRDADLPTDI